MFMAGFENNEQINVWIIGCGWAGEKHARAFPSIPNIMILSMSDTNLERARNLARKWNVPKCCKDHAEMLKDFRIDAVSICLPHYLHSEVAVEAAEAGKDILCEKPIANSLAEADAMIRAAKKESCRINDS